MSLVKTFGALVLLLVVLAATFVAGFLYASHSAGRVGADLDGDGTAAAHSLASADVPAFDAAVHQREPHTQHVGTGLRGPAGRWAPVEPTAAPGSLPANTDTTDVVVADPAVLRGPTSKDSSASTTEHASVSVVDTPTAGSSTGASTSGAEADDQPEGEADSADPITAGKFKWPPTVHGLPSHCDGEHALGMGDLDSVVSYADVRAMLGGRCPSKLSKTAEEVMSAWVRGAAAASDTQRV